MIERDEEFFELESDLASKQLTWDADRKLTRPPNGLKHIKDADLIDRLKYKGFIVTRYLDEKTVHSDKLLDAWTKLGHNILPFMDFVWRAVDPLREEDCNA